MKLKKLLLVLAVISVCGASITAKAKNAYQVSVMEEFKPDSKNKKLGYQFIENGNKVVFVFDAAAYGIERPEYVFVEGSFNGWKKKDPNYQLAEAGKKLFILIVETGDIMVPGNSGYPEFKFICKFQKPYDEYICGQKVVRYKTEEAELNALKSFPGYQMATNNLILRPEDDANYVIENLKIAEKVKKLKDFNLDNPEDVATISNFRQVPGTTKLFRGYHPYKKSRMQFDTEETRVKLVNKQLKDNGVKSIITLSGEEALDKKESMSVYVTDIRTQGNWLFVNTHYNVVYYKSTSKEFGELMAEIIKFIGSHPGPYYVHCRLGTDRTGVISATLAALCGASWDEIAADYQKTNNMGIKEFRDYKLLQYSFEKILGHPIAETEDLQKEFIDYFTGRNFVTKADVDALIANLK